MNARIKEKREVAKGTLLVVFDLLGEKVEFDPGQYFFVTLPDIGHQDDKGLRRHISVVTAPHESGVLGLATRLRDTAFKRTLAELSEGAEVDVEPPKGNFKLPQETPKPLVFVAGGIGITVFRSMLRHLAETGFPTQVTLIYSNRDRESTAFLDELEQLEGEHPELRVILTMTQDPSWDGEHRKIDAAFFKDYLGDDLNGYAFLVAGPPDMVEGMKEALAAAGVQEENVTAAGYSGY